MPTPSSNTQYVIRLTPVPEVLRAVVTGAVRLSIAITAVRRGLRWLHRVRVLCDRRCLRFLLDILSMQMQHFFGPTLHLIRSGSAWHLERRRLCSMLTLLIAIKALVVLTTGRPMRQRERPMLEANIAWVQSQPWEERYHDTYRVFFDSVTSRIQDMRLVGRGGTGLCLDRMSELFGRFAWLLMLDPASLLHQPMPPLFSCANCNRDWCSYGSLEGR